MTREELYASIYTHDTIYLPPWEEQSAPLEVALGCSWGKCRFCDFAKDTFSLHSDEKIEENLKILSKLQPENPRVFFLGENAFVIESERLLRLPMYYGLTAEETAFVADQVKEFYGR